MNTIVLVTGYARAGKDSFASGIKSGSNHAIRISFADSLKDAADYCLSALNVNDGVSATFHDEQFKTRNRHMLVSIGQVARSLNVDVFADKLANHVNAIQMDRAEREDNSPFTIVVPDWRYMNELRVIKTRLPSWRVLKVYIQTAGVTASNEEEGKSIGEIIRNVSFDFEFHASPDSADAIISAGREFALANGL